MPANRILQSFFSIVIPLSFMQQELMQQKKDI